jgi:hypothetical protein
MKIKAIFLLFVFLLNTAVGLRCALSTAIDDCRDGCKEEISNGGQHQVASIEKPDTCCQGAVNDFTFLAKLVPQSIKVFIPAPIAFTISYDLYISKTVLEVKSGHPLLIDERQRPPTPDIRIAIQSFQV